MKVREATTGVEYTANPIPGKEGWFVIAETGEKLPRHQLHARFVEVIAARNVTVDRDPESRGDLALIEPILRCLRLAAVAEVSASLRLTEVNALLSFFDLLRTLTVFREDCYGDER